MVKKNEHGISVKKDENISEWYTQVIQKAKLADYSLVSGCIVFMPYSYKLWENAKEYFDKRIKEKGVVNAYFPLLIPEKLLTKEQNHVEGFTPEVAWVTYAGEHKLNERLAIRPTSETIMYDSYSKWVRSHRDLPIRINQWNNVVRWEFKHAVPFLRTREFLWQEGHTAFATKEEADEEVRDILKIYKELFEDLYAIQSLEGMKSEKEKFAGADYTTSIEIILPNGKGIQGATSHALGQNFAKVFDISFLDNNENKSYVWQNSWGFSTRSLGILFMMHGDDKGLKLPPRIAPIHCVIVPILFENSKEEVLSKAKELKEKLERLKINLSDHENLKDYKRNLIVKLDDREEYRPGWKFAEWELKGVPLRLELGPKDLEKDQVILVRRDSGDKIIVNLNELEEKILDILNDIQKNLLNYSKKILNEKIVDCNSFEEFVKLLDQKKIGKCYWCDSIECEEDVKEKTSAKTLNKPFIYEKEFIKGKKCFNCGNEAKVIVLFGKSY